MIELASKLTAYCRAQLPAELAFLRRLVEVNSFTLNRDGVRRNADLVAEAFAPVGFKAERMPAANPAHGDHLFLKRPGTEPVTICLITHLDTVFPADKDFAWEERGDRIYGPGVIDIKGGTMMIHLALSALREIALAAFERVTWLVAGNAAEEVLATDFSARLLERTGDRVLAGLVFEPGAVRGNTFTLAAARKGKANFRVSVAGRSAHAGNNLQHGANAIVQLAEVVARLAGVTDHARGISCNVGTICGGTVVNVVPALAEATVEARAETDETLREAVGKVMACHGMSTVASAADGFACRVRVEKIGETAPLPKNAGTERLLGIWREAARELDCEVVPELKGGLSDANFLWQEFPVLDGLGASGGNMHCAERGEGREPEFLDVPAIVPKAALNALAILRLLNQSEGNG
jgi:glutamate carboxypeptidase